jgi:hypothetical protein
VRFSCAASSAKEFAPNEMAFLSGEFYQDLENYVQREQVTRQQIFTDLLLTQSGIQSGSK